MLLWFTAFCYTQVFCRMIAQIILRGMLADTVELTVVFLCGKCASTMRNVSVLLRYSGLLEMPLMFRQYDYLEYYPQLQQLHSSSTENWLHCFIYCAVLNKFVHGQLVPSVLWRCWLGGRKGVRPVKNWVVGCWCGYLSGARCRLAYAPADATATHCLLLQ